MKPESKGNADAFDVVASIAPANGAIIFASKCRDAMQIIRYYVRQLLLYCEHVLIAKAAMHKGGSSGEIILG